MASLGLQQPATTQQSIPLFPGWTAPVPAPSHPPAFSQYSQPSMSRVVTPIKSQTGVNGQWNTNQPSTTLSMMPVTPESSRQQKSPDKHVHKAGCTKVKVGPMTPLPFPKQWRNPMFRNKDNENTTSSLAVLGIPYGDNDELDPEDGTRSNKFMVRMSSSSFSEWLRVRKHTWRSNWNVEASVSATRNIASIFPSASSMPTCWTNSMFRETSIDNSGGETEVDLSCPIQYSDNNTFDPYDGSRLRQFIVPVHASNWSRWLKSRKQTWRSKWKVYKLESDEPTLEAGPCENDRQESSVRYDFWAEQYPSFDAWLAVSTAKWKNSYSWNSRKRKRIQKECEEVVQFPSSHDPDMANLEFMKWLKVRKNQWRVLRRRRQRRLDEAATQEPGAGNHQTTSDFLPPGVASIEASSSENHTALVHMSGDFMHIDALLEEEERKTQLRKEREPIDISFLFLPSSGCPDDVVAHCLQYLKPSEHGKLLCINKKFAAGLKSRSLTWQQLCPSHWCLPRRPRKPWHELYLSKLRMEATTSRKQWDDLVSKISDVLLKGDQLKVVMKLIQKAQRKFSFTVDYISGESRTLSCQTVFYFGF